MDKIVSFRETFSGGGYNKPNTGDLAVFRKAVLDHQQPRDFLLTRKNLSEDTIKYFMLGYDYYRNQITIPETKDKECVNVAYCSLDETKNNKKGEKYSKEKGCENWIFHENGLNVAKEKGGILVVSNQFDAMSAWQAGFKNVISVPVGKNGYGIWMELFNTIPKVYISFENNKLGKKMGIDLAERIGIDKCYEIQLPDEIEDLNEYFKKYDPDGFKELVRQSKQYYKYTYQDLGSVIESIKEKGEKRLELKSLPYVKIDDDWMIMVSGVSNIGKTSYVMNLADELIKKDIKTLVIPFERGIRTSGSRYLQIRYEKTEDELIAYTQEDWDEVIPDVVDIPLYFSFPTVEQV